jgi:membrane protein
VKSPWLPRELGELPSGFREWGWVQWRAARDLPRQLREDAATESAAGMTFFLLFSLFPAILFLVSLLPYLPMEAPVDEAFEAARPLLPREVFDLLNGHVMGLLDSPRRGLITGSAVLTLFAASRGLVSLSRALNRAHRVPRLRSEIKRRLRSMLLTLFVLLCVVLGIVSLSFGDDVVGRIVERGLLPVKTAVLIIVVRWPVLLGLSSFGVQQLYFLLPDRRPVWRPWSVGSVLAVLGWVAATWGFTALAGRFIRFNVTYGSLGSVVVVMAWMYLGSLALIVGGTFNALVARGLPGETSGDEA